MAAKLTGGFKSGLGRDPDYPLVGETLGLWFLRGGIGRGGMGEVYEAEYDYLHLLTLRYERRERSVIRQELAQLPREEQARMASEMLTIPLPADARFAIKVCSARRGTAGYRRFLQEAELAEKLGVHPYIVAVHAIHKGLDSADEDNGVSEERRKLLDSGKYHDLAYMVMTLAVRSYDHTKLALNEAIHIVRCIATALDHAHANHVIHRDLKPENILGDVEHPLLTDFGIAKEIDQSLGLTRTGQVIGTLDYMSPEQATDAKAVDKRSDIYSLGVVLYEFATGGHLPYIHLAEREACLAAIRSETGQPKWPRDHVKKFPANLERIILKATAHKPEDRYQEMSDFINDLDRFARNEWISPWGRIKIITWLRYLRHRHTRIVYGIPVLILLLVLLWFGLWAAVFFDSTRNHYEKQILRIAAAEQQIGHGIQQLSQGDTIILHGLLDAFNEEEQHKYPALYQQVLDLSHRVAINRYLAVRFVNDEGKDRLNEAELLLASGIKSETHPWSLTSDGLRVTDNKLKLRLQPYGDGLVFVLLEFRNDTDMQDFKLEISEFMKDGSPPPHATQVVHRNGALQIETRSGEKVTVLPWSGDGTTHKQIIILEVSSTGVRSWPLEMLSDKPAMTANHPAEVNITLPRNTYVTRLEIWPRSP